MVEVPELGRYMLIGESLDDAAGEAFDKVGKMLGLPYPGGPHVAKLSESGRPGRFEFPRPMTNRPGLDFSFSGLKTFTMNTVEKCKIDGVLDEQTRADIAWEFQEAVVDTMVIKCRRAFQHSGMNRLVIAGGVSANIRLREKLEKMAKEEGGRLHYPGFAYCTDNGAMIAYAGCMRLIAGQHDDLSIQAKPRWSLETLPILS